MNYKRLPRRWKPWASPRRFQAKLLQKQPLAVVAPLNWGLGHATRVATLIRWLRQQGYLPILVAEDKPLQWLMQAFPELPFVQYPTLRVRYSGGYTQQLALLKLLPRLWRAYRADRYLIKQLYQQYPLQLILADNRPGIYHRRVQSVYITHQLSVIVPPPVGFMRGLFNRLHCAFIKPYTQCWLPDVPQHPGMAGDLIRHYRLPAHAYFIGNISRFRDIISASHKVRIAQSILVILSGPEPQRTMFEQEVARQLANTPYRVVLLRGMASDLPAVRASNLVYHNHLPDEQLAEMIQRAQWIISRSGYTTVMDLLQLQRHALLVPTPGQTEQVYLAQHLAARGWFVVQDQRQLNIEEALQQIKQLAPLPGYLKNAHGLPVAWQALHD